MIEIPRWRASDNVQKLNLRFAEVLRLSFSHSPRCGELHVRRCDLAREEISVSLRGIVLDGGIWAMRVPCW